MAQDESLRTYRDRRDFDRSPEPVGYELAKEAEAPIFVVQKHDASKLHYDLRLQYGDVLKSWALPKGPSMNPAEKRLAVPTEDHPLEYATFEGVIPPGEYGAGPVIVWDCGGYENVSSENGKPLSFEDAMTKGHLSLILHGQKLKGGFSLLRLRNVKDEAWLFVKTKDSFAQPDGDVLADHPASVISGRTIEDMHPKR